MAAYGLLNCRMSVWVGSALPPSAPLIGARLRLKKPFDVSVKWYDDGMRCGGISG